MAEPPVIKPAVIVGTSLSIADHGALSSFVHLEFADGSVQGFGGYCLYALPEYHKGSRLNTFAGHYIARILQIAGASTWEDLKGKKVLAECNLMKIFAIGKITNDDWFNIGESLAKANAEYDARSTAT